MEKNDQVKMIVAFKEWNEASAGNPSVQEATYVIGAQSLNHYDEPGWSKDVYDAIKKALEGIEGAEFVGEKLPYER